MTTFTETITGNAQTVNELRKAGNLQDALTLACILMDDDPTNLWNRRAMAWIGIEYLKIQSIEKIETAKWICRLIDLDMTETDAIFWEQFRWRVGTILFQQSKISDVLPEWLMSFLRSLPRKPGKAHGFVLRAILKYTSDLANLPALIAAWGWNMFIEDDLVSERLPDGKNIPALAERAYSAAAKYYLNSGKFEPDEVTSFIEELGKQATENPSWLYAVYYQALLLQKMGRIDEAKQVIMPFVRRKPNEFWVWDLLGTIYAEDTKIQQACYARALCCKTPETFLLNVRQKLAALLADNNQWSEARVEIDALCKTRIQNNWRIPAEVLQWKGCQAYIEAHLKRNNDDLYTSLRQAADILLLDAGCKHHGVIWKVNKEKQTASFFVNDQIHGGFSYARLTKTLEVGDSVVLYLENVIAAESQYYKVTHLDHNEGTCPDTQIRSFEGRLRISGSIGFVGDVFISADLMVEASKAPACGGKAVKTFDHKRNAWGWKAFCLLS